MLWWSFLQLFLSLCHQQLKKKSGSDVGRFQDSCSKKLLSWWNCLLLIPPPISLFSGSLSQILTCWGSGFLTTFWDDLQKDNSTENSVEIARKTADFGIELSENFNRWPGPTLLCLHSLVHGLSESKGFSLISGREKKWIGKESESENRAIPTEFARNSRVFFFSN